MTFHLQNALREFETLVESKQAQTFHIYIQQNGLLLKAIGTEKKQYVNLDKENLNALRMFFLGLNHIEYGTFDYTNLICFMHSHKVLNPVVPKSNS
jgi:hypothetical protein